MPGITLAFVVLSTVGVFVIAAVVIGREARRLDAVAPRAVWHFEEALEYVSAALPTETQARLTLDELGELLRSHIAWMHARGLQPDDVVDRPQDIADPLVVDDLTLAAHLLAEAERRGVKILDDVDVVHVVDAHVAYFEAIGAVGPRATDV
ncbi:MAG: hypothetical protein ACO3RB_04025 [Ilumatobacteraceae bacterium]